MEPQRHTVEAVARTAVDDPSATLLEWSSERLGAGASEELGQTEGLRRVAGKVATAGGQRRWSAIVKSLRRIPFDVGGVGPDIDDPQGIHFWRREANAYASGVLDDTGDCLRFLDVPMSDHVEFEAAVIDGYVSGLRATGWTGNESALRTGYRAALSLFMGVAAAGVWFRGLNDPETADFAERVIGRSIDDISEQWAEMQPYLLELGAKALLTAV